MVFRRKIYGGLWFLMLFQAFVVAKDCETDCKKGCQNTSQNHWLPRPFTSYKSREMAMLQDHISRDTVLSYSAEYMQNFGCHSDRLGSLPFWSGSNMMTIGTNDGESDLDAYQLGLGEVTKQGSITLRPKVQHVGGEMLWRVAYDEYKRGPYFQVKVPIGVMMVESQVDENPAQLSDDQDPDWSLYPGQSVRFKTVTDALVNAYEHREPDLKFGRLCNDRNTVVRSGDVEIVAGYNVVGSEKGYFGAGFKLSCPTGNVPEAQFMLEPIFGRGGHWGVGGELAGSYRVYDNDSLQMYLSMRGDVLHLTTGRRPHWRSFDLALNGQGSKYLLLQRYLPTVTVDNNVVIEERMAGEILPAINITTVPVFSKHSVEGSCALAFNLQKDQWNFNLVGEVWGRTHECLQLDCHQIAKTKEENLNDFAVLGRQISKKDLNGTTDLHYCEPLAQINKSEKRVTMVDMTTDKVKDAKLSENRIPADHETALDVVGAQAPSVVTGKVSFDCGYTWDTNELKPHVSLFGGVEFANQKSKFENLWSLGVQGSIVF